MPTTAFIDNCLNEAFMLGNCKVRNADTNPKFVKQNTNDNRQAAIAAIQFTADAFRIITCPSRLKTGSIDQIIKQYPPIVVKMV
jgi:hypothetical protein